MNELRIALLVLGLGVIALVWWLKKREFIKRDARLRKQSKELSDSGAWQTNDAASLDQLASRIKTTDEDTEEAVEVKPANDVSDASTDTSDTQTEDNFMVLRVRAKHGAALNGDDVLQALEREGLTFGKFKIFHRWLEDTDELPDSLKQSNQEQAVCLFSVASLTPPGVLDPDTLSGTTLTGVTCFFDMQESADAVLAFTNMLSTSRRLATVLGAELTDATGSVVSRQLGSHLRDEVISFEHRKRMSA